MPEEGPRLAGHAITRRGFLRGSAGATALLAAGGSALGCEDGRYAALLEDVDAPAVLPRREYAVLRAVAERMVPGGAEHPGAIRLGVPARVDRELGFHPPRLAGDVTGALRLVEWWPLASRLSRFTGLEALEKDAVLAGMATSRFALRRTAFQGLKFLVMFFHYTQEPAWTGTGYAGPWVPRVRPPQVA